MHFFQMAKKCNAKTLRKYYKVVLSETGILSLCTHIFRCFDINPPSYCYFLGQHFYVFMAKKSIIFYPNGTDVLTDRGSIYLQFNFEVKGAKWKIMIVCWPKTIRFSSLWYV